MCGIAGFINFINNNNHKEDLNTLNLMINSLSHRGPDNTNVWTSQNKTAYIAHSRLSIIDLSNQANQPMISQNKQYVLSFNGEIYNFIELKTELEQIKNINFKTSSDTEVLLELISEYGFETAIKKITGMFALCLWDNLNNTLHLARDRIGEKPIYYCNNNNSFIFASEIKALLKYKKISKDININSLSSYFKYGYFPSPNTIFKNIYKLNPGEYLFLDLKKNNSINLNKYWEYKNKKFNTNYEPFIGNINEAENIIENKLYNIISKQKISDVPIGTFLSGGVDSSLVTSILSKIDNDKINTFTIGFNDKRLDESNYASKIAKYLNTNHNELIVTDKDLLDVVYKIPKIFDEPFSDSSQIPNYLVSSLAKNNVTVALSGDGGDELFGGYSRYLWANNINSYNPLLKKTISKALSWPNDNQIEFLYKILKYFLPRKYHFKFPSDKIGKIKSILELNNINDVYQRLISIWPNPEILFNDNLDLTNNDYDENLFQTNNTDQIDMMTRDIETYLPDDLLTKVDRTSMSVSLETRAPFLDHDLVEFSSSLPINMKINKNNQKIILKNILAKYIPVKYFDRPKMGFEVPIDDWLRGPLKEYCYDTINSFKSNKIFAVNKKIIDEKIDQHMKSNNNWHYQIWNILVFQSWIDEYLK